jgi:tetratricopeptide (TPR) repeat protein
MKVPFQLRRLTVPGAGASGLYAEPAHALLLPGHDVRALLALCARLGTMPRVHATAAGFLLKLPTPTTGSFPGAIRLRGLADDLFVPADAELMPALRDDEAAGLVRRRGLVFLPGGRVVAFAPDQSLAPTALLTADRVPPRTWQPFPPRPALPDRIREVLLDRPQDTSDAVLEAGGAGIGSEAPQPPEAAPGKTLLGQAKLTAGQGLINLGRALGLRQLAELGAGLVGSALAQVPRLSASVIGRQEAALRELLREFRDGSLERALRRALPLGSDADRGGQPSQGHQLPLHGARYSLADLLGSGSGPSSIWFGGYNVQDELRKEYRKAAEQALRAGDYRRAAFIYGRLLRDFRQAANALFQGGLHHDAAVLYLEKLGDTLSAARAFAAAGETDRAVQLYRQRGDHLEAADLLRRAGEEEAALVEYRAAADKLLLSPQGYLGAGEVLLQRAGRPDLALEYFRRGWDLRPEANAVPCALHLAQLHAGDTSPGPLLGLLDEADAFFEPPGNDQAAGPFYNCLAQLAERPNLAAARDDLRDRCLRALAGKLRQNAAAETRPGDLVSTLLGRGGAWAPAVVSDAQFAVQAALKRPRPAAAPERRAHSVKLLDGPITAACLAPATGRVFLGNARGEVACLDPLAGCVRQVRGGSGWPVAGLSTDAEGHFLVALEGVAPGEQPTLMASAYLSGRTATEFELFVGGRELLCRPAWLTPLAAQGTEDLLALWQGSWLEFLKGPFLTKAGELPGPVDGLDPAAMVVLPAPPSGSHPVPRCLVLLLADEMVWCVPFPGMEVREPAAIGWTPGRAEGSTLYAAPLSWLRPHPDHLELAGMRGDGNACWSLVQFGPNGQPQKRMTNVTRESKYQAAALVRPHLVAAVGTYRIDWLRAGFSGFAFSSATHVALPGVVACFPSHPTRELLVVSRDGVVVRVPVSN